LPWPQLDSVCSDSTDYVNCDSHIQYPSTKFVLVMVVLQGLGHSMMGESNRHLQTNIPLRNSSISSRHVSCTKLLDAHGMIGQLNRLPSNAVLGRDCFLQPWHQSPLIFGQSNYHKLNQEGDELLPLSSGLAIPSDRNPPYPLPRKSSLLGGHVYLKKVCFQNPMIWSQPVPMCLHADILQRVDNIRCLQQTVFQELQDLMAVQE